MIFSVADHPAAEAHVTAFFICAGSMGAGGAAAPCNFFASPYGPSLPPLTLGPNY